MLVTMTTAPLRKDAARNWHRIVEVGRRFVDEGTPIQLNDVARAASVGVATVYRHFPTPEALVETVAIPGFEALLGQAERALAGDDPYAGLRDFLYASVDALLADASLSPVFAAPVNVLPHTAELKRRLADLSGRILDRARAAGAVDPGVTQDHVVPLMCGVVYAASVHPAACAEDRAAAGRRFLTVMLEGLRVRAS
ncbi:TetR family transcriptional regulator [Nonomuraea fuscirosea]|uniref:TetR family transcriptional regulator n=2 Tax=Nonomuraea fuscirosea TaxID=1291556 RepID=A0A2T0M6H0_9ACTN|nr:TetR family transcriptional regulator [Nonomuraea fuscirosea]